MSHPTFVFIFLSISPPTVTAWALWRTPWIRRYRHGTSACTRGGGMVTSPWELSSTDAEQVQHPFYFPTDLLRGPPVSSVDYTNRRYSVHFLGGGVPLGHSNLHRIPDHTQLHFATIFQTRQQESLHYPRLTIFGSFLFIPLMIFR